MVGGVGGRDKCAINTLHGLWTRPCTHFHATSLPIGLLHHLHDPSLWQRVGCSGVCCPRPPSGRGEALSGAQGEGRGWLVAGLADVHYIIFCPFCFPPQHIQLFALLLAQDLPTATFRYALTLTDIVYALPWRNARDFELLAKVLYPFLEVSLWHWALTHDTIHFQQPDCRKFQSHAYVAQNLMCTKHVPLPNPLSHPPLPCLPSPHLLSLTIPFSLLAVQEEKVEDAVVELSSFIGSALSAHRVLDYLLLLLLKGQEPLVSKVGGASGWGTTECCTVTQPANSTNTVCCPAPHTYNPAPSTILPLPLRCTPAS